MVRDWMMIREILVAAEEKGRYEVPSCTEAFTWEQQRPFEYHAKLLVEHGSLVLGCGEYRLTWKGHDLVAYLRDGERLAEVLRGLGEVKAPLTEQFVTHLIARPS